MTDISPFSIKFEGPALINGTINAKDLGQALVSIELLFNSANAVVNQKKADLITEVSASRAGSFEIFFDLKQIALQQTHSLLAFAKDEDVIAVSTIIGYIFAAGTLFGGALKFILWLNGKKIKKIDKADDEKIRITSSENEEIIIHKDVLSITQDLRFRESLHNLIFETLDKEGIEQIVFAQNETRLYVAKKTDKEAFKRPKNEEITINAEMQRRVFSIVSLSFEEDKKWRLSDGSGNVTVLIEDEKFLQQVSQSNVSFSKDDLLECTVEIRQIQTDKGLRNEYIIKEVLRHIPGLKQLKLPFDS